MDIIEIHNLTKAEQIKQLGEENARYLFYIYEQILLSLSVLIILWMIWSFVKLCVRTYVFTTHKLDQWKEGRKKGVSRIRLI